MATWLLGSSSSAASFNDLLKTQISALTQRVEEQSKEVKETMALVKSLLQAQSGGTPKGLPPTTTESSPSSILTSAPTNKPLAHEKINDKIVAIEKRISNIENDLSKELKDIDKKAMEIFKISIVSVIFAFAAFAVTAYDFYRTTK